MTTKADPPPAIDQVTLHCPGQGNRPAEAQRTESKKVAEQLSKAAFFQPRFFPGIRLHVDSIVSGQHEDRMNALVSDDPKAAVSI